MVAIMPCFFSRHIKLTCIMSEQSIAAIIYDGGRTYFGIDKKFFSADFGVKFTKKNRAKSARLIDLDFEFSVFVRSADVKNQFALISFKDSTSSCNFSSLIFLLAEKPRTVSSGMTIILVNFSSLRFSISKNSGLALPKASK